MDSVREAPARPEEAGVIEAVYRSEVPRLWRAVLAFTGDPEVASDAVAEAFAQCLRRGDAIRSPAAWIWRAAFRIAAGELKSRARMSGAEVEEAYEMAEPAGELVWALGRLPPRQRAALVLRYYGGYSAKEAAAVLGSTAATVRVHLSRGRRRLRALLGGDDVEA
jgi:RNA polymerase sigma factor (sigma-70 family)